MTSRGKYSSEKRLPSAGKNIKQPVFKEYVHKNDVSKNSYAKPPVVNPTQLGHTMPAGSRGNKIDYKDITANNGWLDRHSGDMKNLLGLEESGTFEQMEKLAEAEPLYHDPKGIFNVHNNEFVSRNTYKEYPVDGKDSLDLTGMETLKRISAKEEQVKPAQPNLKQGQNQKPLLFDCDVSEIKQNR